MANLAKGFSYETYARMIIEWKICCLKETSLVVDYVDHFVMV